MTYRQKLDLIDSAIPDISIRKQCELLDISKSSYYYTPVVSAKDIRIMNALDELYTLYPFYGHRRMKFALKDEYGIEIGRKKTLSLMAQMGLQAIYPKKNPNTSKFSKQHTIYPYLLRNINITKPNQVWGTDITYIRLQKGFAYLVAILDWFSRYIVSWNLAQSLDAPFCIQALKQALQGNTIPQIHNSDQGSQFTSKDYIATLRHYPDIQISMDSRGRCLDNIFTERLWRTIKYENVYLNEYETYEQARHGITEYITFYNTKRRHQALQYQTPEAIYFK